MVLHYYYHYYYHYHYARTVDRAQVLSRNVQWTKRWSKNGNCETNKLKGSLRSQNWASGGVCGRLACKERGLCGGFVCCF